MLDKVKECSNVVLAGDGRHDSMGHSAKYCAYTIFCCTDPSIIHFSLVQVTRYLMFKPLLNAKPILWQIKVLDTDTHRVQSLTVASFRYMIVSTVVRTLWQLFSKFRHQH